MGDEILIARIHRTRTGGVARVLLWPDYGVVAPMLVTSNGNPRLVLVAAEVWSHPDRPAASRWEPVHPDAPRAGATPVEAWAALETLRTGRAPSGVRISEMAAWFDGHGFRGTVLAGEVSHG